MTSGSPCLDHARASWEDDSYLTHYIAEVHITLRRAKIKTPHPTCTHTYNSLAYARYYFLNNYNNVPPSQTPHTHRLFSRMSARLPPTLHHTHPYAHVNCWTVSRRCVWVWNEACRSHGAAVGRIITGLHENLNGSSEWHNASWTCTLTRTTSFEKNSACGVYSMYIICMH